jgi:hypothetical protein
MSHRVGNIQLVKNFTGWQWLVETTCLLPTLREACVYMFAGRLTWAKAKIKSPYQYMYETSDRVWCNSAELSK